MKTDYRGIVANDSPIDSPIDALNRVTEISYSDGTPTVRFSYEGRNWGAPMPNTIGRLSMLSHPQRFASSIFGYDSMGRLSLQSSCGPSNCGQGSWNVSAGYDLAGNLVDLTYPDGHHVHQIVDAANRLSSSNLADVAGAPASQSYVESVAYSPDGSPNVLTLGNGVQQSVQRNNRLEVQSLSISSPLAPFENQSFLSHSYCYVNCSTGGAANNGNIWGVTDNLNASNTQGFTYDSLNRIQSFYLGGAVNQQFSIDSFGNMSQLASGGAPSYQFDPANRIGNLPCASSLAPYDASGNQRCSTDQNGAVSQYTYDAENRISQISSLNSPAAPFVNYSYGADGTRIRKTNADGTYTEYVDFAGQPLAERDQTGAWTDYVYANGQKIARVAATQNVIRFHGNDCPGCNANWVATHFSPGLGYTIQAGDKFVFKQRQSGISAGLYMYTAQGSDSCCAGIVDQNGDSTDFSSATDGRWHDRVVDLTPFAGQTVVSLGTDTQVNPPIGVWDVYYADVAILSANGAVLSIYNGQPNFAMAVWGAGGQTELSATVENVTDESSSDGSFPGSHFYLGDHLGTAQMELSSGGWPVWQGQFAPYGQELDTQPTTNHYKFTGKERDAESGLDYFGARYYASNMGRWMSPDWADKPEAVPYSDLANPQSLNLYGYVGNNPLSHADADGHCCVDDFKADRTDSQRNMAPLTADEKAGMAQAWHDSGIGQFFDNHPVLTNLGVNLAIAIMTKGEGGEVAMPRLTEGGEAVPSAPSMGAGQREVMRQEGVPTSQQPSSQQNITNSKGESVGRQYTYKDSNGQTKIVQRNNGTDSSHPGQPHVEGGSPKANGQTDSLGRPRLDNSKTKVNVKKPDGQ